MKGWGLCGAIALAVLLTAGVVGAQSCGGAGELPCPATPSPQPPIVVPSPQPLSTSPLEIVIGVPTCALASPPCFTVDVKLVPVEAPAPISADHAPVPVPPCGTPGGPPCS